MLQREHSAILWTFIKLPVVIKTFVFSIFKWSFYTGFTVVNSIKHVFVHFNYNIIKYICSDLVVHIFTVYKSGGL